MPKKNQLPLIYIIINILMVFFSFLVMNYIKRGTIILSEGYCRLLLLYFIIWILISLFNGKFKTESYKSFTSVFTNTLLSTLYQIYVLAFLIVIFNLFEYSRLHILGAYGFLLIFELILLSHYFYTYQNNVHKPDQDPKYKKLTNVSVKLLLIDGFLFILSMAVGYYLVYNHLPGNILSLQMGILFIGLWFLFGMWTSKFHRNIRDLKNFWYIITPILKTFLFIVLTSSLLVYFARINLPFKIIVSILIFYLISDGTLYLILNKLGFFNKKNHINSDKKSQQKQLEITDPELRNNDNSCPHNNIHKYHRKFQNLLEKIPNFDNLWVLEKHSTEIKDLDRYSKHSLDAIINTCRFNHISYINRYLIELHHKLKSGGYFLGHVYTIEQEKRKLEKKYPHFFHFIFYPFHFIFLRVFPKLPVLRSLYLYFNGGKRRALSKAEALGRLYYCGFKILETQETPNGFLFLSKKMKTPSRDPDPSFGPLIKLDRVGMNGEVFKLYKFRTMHPYSEYLQDYIHEINGIQENGKFSDDFRVTEWGRWFRRLWIDELPQLYNWVKGDIKIVGVRALSEHYFSLYPEDVQELRTQTKPGLVPPYYADMPDNFEEIVESERKYLLKKKEKPFLTDFTYFFKVFNNIIFHNARSQ